jgi:hypothetical protein
MSIGERENSASRHRCSKGNRSEPQFLRTGASHDLLRIRSRVQFFMSTRSLRSSWRCPQSAGSVSIRPVSSGLENFVLSLALDRVVVAALLIMIASVQFQGGSLNYGIGAIDPLFLSPHVSVKVCADVVDDMKG